jgi:ArsR family transcriptional regulator, arsenate/arsenite/antimonite-responsive transcriptional repressor
VDREKVERISKALADETRLIIFEEISAHPEMTCGEIVSLRKVTPATISHHLKVLHDAGLIECRKDGQFVHSRPVRETVEAYAAALQKMAGAIAKSQKNPKATRAR